MWRNKTLIYCVPEGEGSQQNWEETIRRRDGRPSQPRSLLPCPRSAIALAHELGHDAAHFFWYHNLRYRSNAGGGIKDQSCIPFLTKDESIHKTNNLIELEWTRLSNEIEMSEKEGKRWSGVFERKKSKNDTSLESRSVTRDIQGNHQTSASPQL